MAEDQEQDLHRPRSGSVAILEEDAELFRTAVELSDDAVMITGPELGRLGPTIGFVNRAMVELTGYTQSELVGRSTRVLEGPRVDQREARRRKRSLLSNGFYTGEAVIYRKDGSTLVARSIIKAIPQSDGGVRGWLATLQRQKQRTMESGAPSPDEIGARALLEGIPHLVWQSRDNGQWCAASPQWSAYTGQSHSESLGLMLRQTTWSV